MNDPIHEIEAAQVRSDLSALDGAIARSVRSPWRRFRHIVGALATVAVLLFGALTIAHRAPSGGGNEGATSCPTPFYVQSYTNTNTYLGVRHDYRVWWAYSNGQIRTPYCTTVVSSYCWYQPGYTYSYINPCSGGNGGGSW